MSQPNDKLFAALSEVYMLVQTQSEQAIAARDKWWIEQIEKYKAGGFGSFDADEGDVLLYGFRWKQLKERTNGNSNKRL